MLNVYVRLVFEIKKSTKFHRPEDNLERRELVKMLDFSSQTPGKQKT